MTSISLKSRFRLTLLNVSKHLTDDDARKLLALTPDLTLYTKTNARNVFDALQDRKLLSEYHVELLISWLDKLQLSEAFKCLKSYQCEHLTGHVESPESCRFHEDQIVKYLCESCNITGCPECIVSDHNKPSVCNVIPPPSIPDKIKKAKAKLDEEITSARKSITAVEKLLQEKECLFNEYHKGVESKIHNDSISLNKLIDCRKEQLLQQLDVTEKYYHTQMIKAKEDIHDLSKDLKDLIPKATRDDTLNELYNIEKGLEAVQNIRYRQRYHKKIFKMPVDFFYTTNSNNGRFSTLTSSTLIGSAAILQHSLMHLYDERHSSGCVLLVSCDQKNHTEGNWEYLEKIDNHNDPVVMSNIALYYSKKNHLLFAIGGKVFTVEQNKQYDSIESVSSVVINEVKEGSWITSITAHHSNNDSNKEFIITTTFDHKIREYNISGSALRVIDTEHIISNPIIKVAYCKNVIAIICKGISDVILIDTEDKPKQSGVLSLRSSVPGLLPMNIIWTGNKWAVLYFGDGADITWKIASYAKFVTDMLGVVCAEGVAANESDIPVSICRSGYDGYVTFANSSVRKYLHI
ncbi:uncharacterized protein [Apostichopus japonicus]|uniref:uncharacterized protein n=1 Tax=Stichopus japonicus TaxID=307972 RepID=UPI003AB906BC